MLILQLRRAETALADGRLEEAFELARSPDVQAHYKGQRLIGKLARALASRGASHLEANRLEAAGADCEKAALLAGNLPEIALLKLSIAQAADTRRREERRRDDALAAAREHVDNGRLSLGEGALMAKGLDSARAALLTEELADRRRRAGAALERARQAALREDWADAADALVEARAARATDADMAELTAQVVRAACRQATHAVDAGRLDLVEALLRPAESVGGNAIEVRELNCALNACREARAHILAGQPRMADEVLRRLAAIRPAAAWVGEALKHARLAAEQMEALRGGPLALLDASPAPARSTPPEPEPKPLPAGRAPLPRRLLLHVDGGACYLVLRDAQVTLGPGSASRHPTVDLLMDPASPAVVIERMEEDYFLHNPPPGAGNAHASPRKLLTSGERINLSPRAVARFMRPNPASGTAIMHLSGTRLRDCEAREIILMDREIILGPGPRTHIRCDGLCEEAIIQVRDGQLVCRSREVILIDGRPADRNTRIDPGARVRIGNMSLAVAVA